MEREFIKKLYELYVQKETGLLESLKIMWKYSKNKKISETALYIYNQMEMGNLVSSGFKTCPNICFEEETVLFISLSEKTGDLREAVSYLCEKMEREHSNKSKLIELSIYPLFVCLLSIAASVLLFFYSKNFCFRELVEYTGGLVAVILFTCFLIGKGIVQNPLYEAFLVIDFLLSSGTGIAAAVEYASCLPGIKRKYGNTFENAKEKLEFGMSLEHALKLGDKYEEGFYYADKAGGRNQVFGKLAEWIKMTDERKQKICLSMVEPVFMCITGGFLLLLIFKFFLPFYMNFTGV